MSILDYLDTVRAKPEAERRRILVVWTATGMIIIVGLWLGNMLFVLPEPEIAAEPTAPRVSLVSRVSGHVEKIVVGFSALRELVEDKTGFQKTE